MGPTCWAYAMEMSLPLMWKYLCITFVCNNSQKCIEVCCYYILMWSWRVTVSCYWYQRLFSCSTCNLAQSHSVWMATNAWWSCQSLAKWSMRWHNLRLTSITADPHFGGDCYTASDSSRYTLCRTCFIELHPLWILSVMDTFRYGYFPLWILSVMDTFRYGYFPLWILSVMDTFRYGYFQLWILSVMDTFRYGYFPLWILLIIATSHCVYFLLLLWQIR